MASRTARSAPGARRRERGSTLLEAVIAMAVLTIGSMGSVAIYRQDIVVEGDSRKMTRATAIAQDLVNQISAWDYGDARLTDDFSANDAAIGDPSFAIERSDDPLADGLVDHGEADLTKGGAPFNGLPAASIAGYQRYWTVDTSNGSAPDLQRVAVVVRWPVGSSGFHRVVLMVTKPNPAAATR